MPRSSLLELIGQGPIVPNISTHLHYLLGRTAHAATYLAGALSADSPHATSEAIGIITGWCNEARSRGAAEDQLLYAVNSGFASTVADSERPVIPGFAEDEHVIGILEVAPNYLVLGIELGGRAYQVKMAENPPVADKPYTLFIDAETAAIGYAELASNIPYILRPTLARPLIRRMTSKWLRWLDAPANIDEWDRRMVATVEQVVQEELHGTYALCAYGLTKPIHVTCTTDKADPYGTITVHLMTLSGGLRLASRTYEDAYELLLDSAGEKRVLANLSDVADAIVADLDHALAIVRGAFA